MKGKDKIIVALDTDSPARAVGVAWGLRHEVGLYKIGMELFPLGGANLIKAIQEQTNRDIFLDLKFKDIPNTVAGAIRSTAELGVKFCTVHADGGQTMLKAAAKAAEGTDLTILAVTVLTSLDDNDLKEMGNSNGVETSVLQLAKMAVEAGIGGLVCSAKEVAAVRAAVGPNIKLVTPGVRFPEGDAGDQKRVVTPDKAIFDGADYLVVGRPITQADEPIAAARKFASAIERGKLMKGVEFKEGAAT